MNSSANSPLLYTGIPTVAGAVDAVPLSLTGVTEDDMNVILSDVFNFSVLSAE